MTNSYDSRMQMLERRHAIAEALRASGNEALPTSLDSGRIHAPVSGWAHADKLTKQLLAAYMGYKTDKDEKSLKDEQKVAQADWMRGLPEAQAPSDLQPQAPTGNIMAGPGAEESLQKVIKGMAIRGDAQQAVDASDKQKLLSQYMRGTELGGVPEAVGMAGLQRELMPPVSEPFTLGRGDTRFDGRGQKVAAGEPYAADDGATDDIKEYQMAQAAGYKGSLQDWILEQKRAGASSTNVNLPPEQNEEAKAVGKIFGEQYGAMQQAGMDANSKISKYARMGQLLEGVNTGKLQPAFAQIAAIGESFGIKLDEKLGAKQALEALSSEVALTLRNPSGGAGMPGALSDKDREFLMGMTPGLSKTPEGNRLIIETAIKMAERDRVVAKMARDYRKKNKSLDEGFYDELAVYSEANPLFGGMSLPAQTTQPTRPGQAPTDARPPLSAFGGTP